MNNPVFIYALINPLNNILFYIGASNNLKNRLSSHATYRYILKDDKSKIICEIIEAGKSVDIVCLDSCVGNNNEIRDLEEFYIQLYRSYGFNLPQCSKSYYSRDNNLLK